MALLRGSHFAPCLVPPFFPSTPIDLASMPSQFPPNHTTSCHCRIVVVDGRTCHWWNTHVVDGRYVFSMGRTHSYWVVPVIDRAYAWREGQKRTTTKVVVPCVSTGIRRQWAGIGRGIGKDEQDFHRGLLLWHPCRASHFLGPPWCSPSHIPPPSMENVAHMQLDVTGCEQTGAAGCVVVVIVGLGNRQVVAAVVWLWL